MAFTGDDNAKPYDFWLLYSTTDLIFIHFIKRIYFTLANNMPSERSFSVIKFIHNKV